MREKIVKNYSKEERIIIVVALLGVFANSLLIKISVGYVSIIFLTLYFLFVFIKNYSSKITFTISLLLILIATLIYFLGIGGIEKVHVKLTSEWSFLFAFTGVVQLLVRGYQK